MATSYGYKPQKLGYGYQQPQQAAKPFSTMAIAAQSQKPPADPFGLTTGQAGANGYFNLNPANTTPSNTVAPPTTSPGAASPAAHGAPAVPGGGAASGGAVFDINTDPALQQANAFIGMNDAQAQSEALKQRQQALLAYGDPTLAGAVLGSNDPLVTAAGQNPTSTLAQLKQQHDRGLTDMTENFNKENLTYSGARVKGEQQFGQDYENALAQAASSVNSNLGGINSNLSSALATSNAQRVQALEAAYAAHPQQPGVDPNAAAAPTDPNQANRTPITADAAQGPGLAAILAALAAVGGPAAAPSRLNRFAN